MRPGKASAAVFIAAATLLISGFPAYAQDPEEAYEQFERPAPLDAVEGYVRSDDTLILRDQAFCSYLFGAIWADDQLTFSRLLDRSKKQKKAKKAAFRPVADAAVLQRCVDTLNAFRLGAPEEDPLAIWARSGPVVPEALAALLPPDLLSDPLAVPEPIGDGSRTNGFGDRSSAPFGLTAGTYFVQVDDRECASWTGTLRGALDPTLELPAVDGQAYLYEVPPANYYWDVSAPECDWSVDLVAFELGPEPTATPTPKAVVPALYGEKWVDNVAVKNGKFLTAAQARAALLDAGLEAGICTEQVQPPIRPDRVWMQEPLAGTLLEFGATVDVWIGSDCDIVTGDRIVLE